MKKFFHLFTFLFVCGGWAAFAQPLKIEQKGKQILIHINDSLFGKDMIFSSKVVELSAQKNISAGQAFLDPYIFYFEKMGDNVALRKIVTKNLTSPGTVKIAVDRNNATPVMMSFAAEKEQQKGYTTINAAELFTQLNVHNDPLPNGLASGGLISAISGVSNVVQNTDRVNVVSDYYFKGTREPFYAKLMFTIRVAPQAMNPRLNDNRVGYFSTGKVLYTDGDVSKISYATRWRIEPAAKDLKAHKNGKMVEPAKKIVFAFDDATPEFVKKYAKKGILDWNKAFERIGFKNVIEVVELPKGKLMEDTDINLFRYIPTDSENAQGLAWTDPRSGEVMQAEILWYHNVVNLLKTWRFIQTAAADERVRDFNAMSDEVVGEMIRYAVAHEMGHVLGLTHNMRASAARSVAQLTTPDKNRNLGTTASIMDYARFNYVAPEGSAKRGIAMLPPTLGEYDFYAIEWGYRPFYGGEKEMNDFVLKHTSNDVYKFSKGTTRQIVSDPLTASNTLSDDLVESSKRGKENLKVILNSLLAWNVKKGDSNSLVERLYGKIVDQYFMYVNSTASNIGGVYSLDGGAEEHKALYDKVPLEKQREALNCVLDMLVDSREFLTNDKIFAFIGSQDNYIVSKQRSNIGMLMSVNFLEQVSGGMGVEEYLKSCSDKILASKDMNIKVAYLKELKSRADKKIEDYDLVSYVAAAEVERLKEILDNNLRIIIK